MLSRITDLIRSFARGGNVQPLHAETQLVLNLLAEQGIVPANRNKGRYASSLDKISARYESCVLPTTYRELLLTFGDSDTEFLRGSSFWLPDIRGIHEGYDEFCAEHRIQRDPAFYPIFAHQGYVYFGFKVPATNETSQMFRCCDDKPQLEPVNSTFLEFMRSLVKEHVELRGWSRRMSGERGLS